MGSASNNSQVITLVLRQCIGLAFTPPTEDLQLTYSALDQGDVTGRTSLSWVAQQGNDLLVDQLLMCQADLEKADSSGRTPLHWAVVAGKLRCVNSLVMMGADIFAKDKLGRAAIHLAVQGKPSLEIVQGLLSSGADLKIKDKQGMMPLHAAAYYDQPSVVSCLLANGAVINDSDATGRTALLIAISLNNYGVIRLLLSQKSLDYTIIDIFERGLIHFAACLGDVCTLKILSATSLRGLMTYDQDNSGVTGIEYAQWRLLHNKEWSRSVIEPPDPDPLEWYMAFRDLSTKLGCSASGEEQPQLLDVDPYTWESLQGDLAALGLEEDDKSSVDPEDDEEWTDARESLVEGFDP